MRVLHLGKFCPPTEGGIEVFSYDLLEYLNAKGIKADLLCFGNRTHKYTFKNFDVFSFKMNIKLNSAPVSFDLIEGFYQMVKKYDILHIHSPNPLVEFLSIFAPKDKKIIVHWHSDIVRQKLSYIFYKPLQQIFLKRADKIVCTSPQYLETSVQLKSFKNKAIIIPLGLNPNRLEVNSKDKGIITLKEYTKDKKIVLSIGRLVEYKGFEYLIEAARHTKNDIIIVIIGTGPLYGKLRQKIIKMNLENKVILLGRVENVKEYIEICDAFCLPSIARNEAFGLVLVEALYFGKPLITTNVLGSGMSYVNISGKTGLIVKPRDPKALADAINKILSDEKLHSLFSENAKKRFEEFHIKSVGEQILNLYKEI